MSKNTSTGKDTKKDVKKTEVKISKNTVQRSKKKSVSKNTKTKANNLKVNEGVVSFSSKKTEGKKKFSFKNLNRRFNLDLLDLMIMVVITAIVSCLLTGIILNNQYKNASYSYSSELSDDEDLNEFLSTYAEILENYYEDIDKKGMIEAATEGMMNYLEDNYSIYLDQEESSDLNDVLDSSYEGIGLVSYGNVVYSVYEDSPAYNAGIEAGDEIIEVNGEEISSENYDRISTIISESDDVNTIVVLRDGNKLSFEVAKSTVSIPTVESNVISKDDNKIGYVKISSFSTRSYEEVVECLLKLDNEGVDSLIIDLRDNSGGYLVSAKNIASLFLKKGSIIYSLVSKNSYDVVKDDTDDSKSYPIIVLVNGNTASAAEILATSLKDSYGAILVGKKTYGKGKVQNIMQFNDSMVKYTSAKWYRPNGDCVDEVGAEPDYDVDLEYDNGTIYDKQLDKAIELLTKQVWIKDTVTVSLFVIFEKILYNE